jgi:ParB-like chromosome segregation protein Spo0J
MPTKKKDAAGDCVALQEGAVAEPAAIWVDTESLRPWADNPRVNDAAVPGVIESIKKFGWGAPILARKADKEIIAGHTRIKAALILGLPKVPVRYMDLDPAMAHLLAIADNKLAEKSEWDESALLRALNGYDLSDAAIAGFDSRELDKLAKSLDPGPIADDEDDAFDVDEDEEDEEELSPPDDPSLLNPKTDPSTETPLTTLVFGKLKLPMSDDDSERLKQKLASWMRENGSLIGVASQMIDGLP